MDELFKLKKMAQGRRQLRPEVDPELYFLSQLPADMNMSETLSVVIMALSLSFMATIFPAWRASRLDPVQALRYE